MSRLGNCLKRYVSLMVKCGQKRVATREYYSLFSHSPLPSVDFIDHVLPNTKIGFSNGFLTNNFATVSNGMDIQSVGGGLKVHLVGRDAEIPFVWLRDHCRCEVCYNAVTFQKNVENYVLTEDLAAREVQMNGDCLKITWQDGHISTYSLQWIGRNFFPQQESIVKQFLWDGNLIKSQSLPCVPCDVYLKTDKGLQEVLSNILKYGFCIVNEVSVTEESTGTVAERICCILETVFGRLNTVKPDLQFNDTAYTNIAIGAHTDTTYYTLPAGIQLFHILHHDGKGGESLLVDGFNVAEKLRGSNPKYFETLVRTVIPHEFQDKRGHHLYSLGTVLSVDSCTQQLTLVRFNPYDRAPLNTVSAEEIPNFYASYDALKQIIWNKDNYFWLKLQPGMVLLVDNWRVLHGRSAFTGNRIFSSCYLPRDEWRSRARSLELL